MSLQAILNNELFNHLPKLQDVIAAAENESAHNANQMEQITLKAAIDSITPIDSMSLEQINDFQDELIAIFDHNGLFSLG